jgi:LmbE family N-acetylglucosaminyl deacetylase
MVASGADSRRSPYRSALVVVAHPDDETLWAGGLMLTHPECRWTVVTLCRASDGDRAPKFGRAMGELKAAGRMGNLDDGPEQAPLADELVRRTVLGLVPGRRFGLVLTHGPRGEYTRHRRHEEASRAVAALWKEGELECDAFWLFAYDDGGGARLPAAAEGAHRTLDLSPGVWRAKRRIIADVYGFAPDSFEARAAPRREAFWCFDSAAAYDEWFRREG